MLIKTKTKEVSRPDRGRCCDGGFMVVFLCGPKVIKICPLLTEYVDEARNGNVTAKDAADNSKSNVYEYAYACVQTAL
jgi:hypothetical protein